jgi:hypothetical protein
VTALDRLVNVTETKIPLGELVSKLAAVTGVPLVTAREVADEPVAVVVKAMPARELLEQVAGLLDYEWSRQGRDERTRYEISQGVAARQREAALRQAVFAQGAKSLQQELERYGEIAALSQGQIQQFLDAEERLQQQAEQLSPVQREAFDQQPDVQERSRRYRAAQALYSPVSQALALVLRRLSPQQWAFLREAGQVTYTTDPQPGDLPLPEELGRLFRAAVPSSYRPRPQGTARDPVLESWLGRQEQARQEQWAAATGYRVTVRLVANRLESGGSFSLRAEVVPLGSAAAGGPFLAGGGASTRLSLNADEGELQQPAAEEMPQPHAGLENDPVLSVRKSFRLEARLLTSLSDLESSSGLRVQDLLPDLARTYGVQFIADAYWASPSHTEGELLIGEPVSLTTLLDRLAGDSLLWDRVSLTGAGDAGTSAGTLIRLRSRRWFFDRPTEIPLRLIRQWRELCDRHGALPLETCLEMVTSLNDGQLAMVGRLASEGVLPYELRDLSALDPARYALRLYASLTSSQRQALWNGKAIAVGQMAPTQRGLLATALQEGSSALSTFDVSAPSADGLSLAAERWVQIKERRPESIRYYDEPVAAAGATEAGAAPAPTRGGQPAAGAAAARPAERPGERVVVTRHPVIRMRLQFRSGSGRQEIACLTVASPS